MSYTIIKPGDGSSLDPMKLINQYTILQTALLSLFPFGSSGYLRIQSSRPGEELLTFHSIFSSSKKLVTLKDERGIRLNVRTLEPTPDPEVVSLLKFALSTAYEKASKMDLSIHASLTNLYHHPKKHILLQPTPVASTAEIYSFLFDGGIVGEKGRLRKDANFILNEALIDAAKHIVIEAEIDDFSPMTPVQIQNDIIQSLQKQLKIVPEKKEDEHWEFSFEKEVSSLTKYIQVAFETNQGFLRATHPGMILPPISPYALVKQIQTVGEQIANVKAPLLPESKEVEETPEADIPELKYGSIPIIRNKDATGYSMTSQYAIGTYIPELSPPL